MCAEYWGVGLQKGVCQASPVATDKSTQKAMQEHFSGTSGMVVPRDRSMCNSKHNNYSLCDIVRLRVLELFTVLDRPECRFQSKLCM
jgi:hypothetical protein